MSFLSYIRKKKDMIEFILFEMISCRNLLAIEGIELFINRWSIKWPSTFILNLYKMIKKTDEDKREGYFQYLITMYYWYRDSITFNHDFYGWLENERWKYFSMNYSSLILFLFCISIYFIFSILVPNTDFKHGNVNGKSS